MKRDRAKLTPKQKELMRRESAAAERQKSRLRKLAENAEKPRLIQVLVSEEMYAALKAYSQQNDSTLSEVLREAGLRHVGRSDLLSTMRPSGRPRKNPADSAKQSG